MTATSKERLYGAIVEFPHQGTFSAASGAGPFYMGTLVVKDSAGRAAVPTPGGTGDGFDAVGASVATQTNITGAADAVDIQVEFGVIPLKIQGTTPKPGQRCYVVDNQTISITTGPTGGRGFAGICTEVRGTTAYVLIGPLVWGVSSTAGATAAPTA